MSSTPSTPLVPEKARTEAATKVKPGDWIILYTGAGSYSAEKRPDGGTNHFFHWGLPHTLWASPISCAILCEMSNWATIAK
jgi:hypothetical protein